MNSLDFTEGVKKYRAGFHPVIPFDKNVDGLLLMDFTSDNHSLREETVSDTESFAFNNNDSDYGATIILTHNLEGLSFYTLYGHLSLNSLKNLEEGKRIARGEVFTEFGMRFENGNWPPHLHFQIILDMQGWLGDYPGVCKFSEKDFWLSNCPDPDLILDLNRYVLQDYRSPEIPW